MTKEEVPAMVGVKVKFSAKERFGLWLTRRVPSWFPKLWRVWFILQVFCWLGWVEKRKAEGDVQNRL